MARPSPDGVGHPIQILLSTGGATVIDKTPACHPASLLDLRLVLTGVKVPQPSTHNRCSLVLAGKRKNANVGSPHAPRSYRGGQVCGCQGAVAARWRGYLRSPLRYATTRVGVIICQARDCCSAQAPRSPVRVCNVAAVRGLTWCHRTFGNICLSMHTIMPPKLSTRAPQSQDIDSSSIISSHHRGIQTRYSIIREIQRSIQAVCSNQGEHHHTGLNPNAAATPPGGPPCFSS